MISFLMTQLNLHTQVSDSNTSLCHQRKERGKLWPISYRTCRGKSNSSHGWKPWAQICVTVPCPPAASHDAQSPKLKHHRLKRWKCVIMSVSLLKATACWMQTRNPVTLATLSKVLARPPLSV